MKLIVISMWVLVSHSVTGQTSDEWFRQKEKQRKYLLQQIASFKSYADHVRKGFEIAEKGLKVVRDIKDGDLGLHSDFLRSLQLVSPAIRNYARVADIIALQIQILKNTKEALKGAREMKVFSKAELEHCSIVINNLMIACLESIEELLMVISDERFEMKDDERLKRIDSLYADMQDKASFSSSFCGELALLAVQRMRELKEVDISRILNGLK